MENKAPILTDEQIEEALSVNKHCHVTPLMVAKIACQEQVERDYEWYRDYYTKQTLSGSHAARRNRMRESLNTKQTCPECDIRDALEFVYKHFNTDEFPKTKARIEKALSCNGTGKVEPQIREILERLETPDCYAACQYVSDDCHRGGKALCMAEIETLLSELSILSLEKGRIKDKISLYFMTHHNLINVWDIPRMVDGLADAILEKE